MEIREFRLTDIPKIKAFSDEMIGRNYFSEKELEESFSRSQSKGLQCSFVLTEKEEILGLRLAYPPGLWIKGKGNRLSSELWGVPPETVAYFQSLFLAKQVQGQGWGPKLSAASLEAFKKLNAKAVVAHAWKESPHNSSLRYLSKLGFKLLATYPEYWIDLDYECVLDGRPCRCTAQEMILYL
ncbi:MAG: N-acetyltransferase family protein [Pseudobdellovibrionaceae bacterium]